jgi:hypothetical protein
MTNTRRAGTASYQKDEIIVPLITLLFGTIGLILSIIANFNCRYTTSNVTFTETVDEKQVSTNYIWRAGLWNFEDHDVFYVRSSNSIAIVRYYYCVPWNSQTMVERDSYWITAQVFSVISVVLGGIVCITSCCLSCGLSSYDSTVSKNTVSLLGFMFMFIVLCQGLTFLYFTSKACRDGSASAMHSNQDFELEWDGCVLASGGNCSIASMVLYFVGGFILLSPVFCSCNNASSTTSRPIGGLDDDDDGDD